MYCTIVKNDTKYNIDSKYNFIYVKIFIYNIIVSTINIVNKYLDRKSVV